MSGPQANLRQTTQKFLSNEVLLDVLRRASRDEHLALTNLLFPSAAQALSSEDLQRQICRVGGHGVANWFRGQGTGYIDMLDDVVSGLKIDGLPSYMGQPWRDGLSLWKIDERSIILSEKRNIDECRQHGNEYVEAAEGKILLKLLEVAYGRMTDEQRRLFDARVREVAAQFGGNPSKSLAGGAGLLVIGNLGGFATYTLVSTVLGTLSFGALGFGAYTAASSALSVVLGPVGWLALGAAGLHAYSKPSLKQTVPLVANVAAIRQRLKYRRQ